MQKKENKGKIVEGRRKEEGSVELKCCHPEKRARSDRDAAQGQRQRRTLSAMALAEREGPPPVTEIGSWH